MIIERRSHERFTLPLTAIVEYPVGGRRHSEMTQVRDISIGGALLPLSGNPSLGARVQLELLDNRNHLADALGIPAPPDQPLRYRVSGAIIRRQNGSGKHPSRHFAVSFSSPLRIVPGAAERV